MLKQRHISKSLMRSGSLLLGAVCTWFIGVCVSAATAAETASEIDRSKRVVVLYSGPLDFPATQMAESGIRNVFRAEPLFEVQLFSEYLDLSRFRDPPQRRALADLIKERYANSRINLIISVDSPAAEFLLETAGYIFPEKPVVMCLIQQSLAERIDASPLKQRIRVVFEPLNAEEIVSSALFLKPQTKTAVLISGTFENDHIRSEPVRKALKSRENTIEFIDLTGLSIETMIDRVRDLSGDTIIFFSTFFVDGSGRSFTPRDVLKIISANANVPIFGLYESYLGDGIVGGCLLSLQEQGKKAAEIGVRIMKGEVPDGTGAAECSLSYDWRQLKRWNIDMKTLPPGANILYREVTAWELYKFYFIGAFTLLTLQSVLIAALVRNLKRRKKAEMALRESRKDLETLAGRLIFSREEELRRLSREFHDDIAQRLAAVAIESGTLEMQSGAMESNFLQKIGHIKDQLIGLSEDVHTISRELHPSILKDLGLSRAVRSLCISFSDRENIFVDCTIGSLPEIILPESALCIYRIVQEGFQNIAKHAKAQYVQVLLNCKGKTLYLKITDDGVGFSLEGVRYTPGIGLASMRERAQFVRGEFKVSSGLGRGTVIEVSIPLEREGP